MKKTKNLGKKSGKILVFGGVYSNLQALEEIQKISHSLNIPPSNIICTGDIVGYCAQPEESIQSIIKWGIHTIAGNVELQLREGKKDCGCNFESGSRCNTFSELWYPFAQSQLSRQALDWMRQLPDFIQFQYAGKNAFVLHGSYHHPSEYIFKSTPKGILLNNFKATKSNLILAGHSGLPFHRSIQKNTWINAGVIGMPANDGTPRVWYVILNDLGEILSFKHLSFEYNHPLAIAQMHQHQLPPEYALTLETGLWDNCEILPEEETQLQGKALQSDVSNPPQ